MAIGHTFKAVGSLLLALVLLLPPLFFWWQLAYVHHFPGGESVVVWKKVEFGPPIALLLGGSPSGASASCGWSRGSTSTWAVPSARGAWARGFGITGGSRPGRAGT